MTGLTARRLRLAHLPTPLVQPSRLAAHLGLDLWIKRDDATGGPEAGNKIRKLEFLLADAIASGADTLITCGGIQSNHARATATLAAQLGLQVRLLLRWTELDGDDEGRGIALQDTTAQLTGNLLLDALVGAEVRLITVASYRRRAEVMARHAEALRERGRRPYIIPEGGSNGLGALGYVHAMAELREQLDHGEAGGSPFDVVVHACGFGGIAAGVALGAARFGVAKRVLAMAVCDDAPTFERGIRAIIDEARQLEPGLDAEAPWGVDDSAKGPAYAVSTEQQREHVIEVARLAGIVLDPVYTGKAMSGLWRHCEMGTLDAKRVLFLHTGGLPGLLAQGAAFTDALLT